MKVLILLCLVSFVNSAFFATKSLTCSHLFVGQECVVNFKFYNSGPENITNIEVNDFSILSGLTDIQGSTTFELPTLLANHNASHDVVFVPNELAVSHAQEFLKSLAQPVTVRYEVSKDQFVMKSTPLSLPHYMTTVYTDEQFKRKFGSKIETWIGFFAIVGFPTLAALYLRESMKRKYTVKKN
ncbi:unnamed protein product [Auanema sp. JU1783]|nr:unnamed protein product [Auanema sp. JU1783]